METHIYVTIIYIFVSKFLFTLEDDCNEKCSNLYDPVCGEALAVDGQVVIKRFQNICYLNKFRCIFKNSAKLPPGDLNQVPNELCHIREDRVTQGRRVNDFSVVGAHQACNHTCPTYCLDIYDPACAQIWSPDMQTYTYRPMINHCHIDLFSCVMGVNVTIQPLIGKCYKNPTALMFMFHIASLKTLKLLDEPPAAVHTKLAIPATPKRRSGTNFVEDMEFKEFIGLITKRKHK